VAGQFDTYWGTFEEISNYNIGLNYFEKLWLAWYTYMQNDVLATGIMSFVMHEVVYFGRSLPWIIIDCIPWFRRYKIQNVCHQLAPEHAAIAAETLLTNAAAENPNRKGAVAMRKPCPSFALHRRTPTNLAIPPNGTVLRSLDFSSFPFALHNGLPNRHLLRHGRRVALLDAPRHAHLPLPVQKHPQDPPPVLGAVRARRRVRQPDRGDDAGAGHGGLADPVDGADRRPTHPDHVPVDRAASVPGHRRALRLRVPVVAAPLFALLGRRRPPRRPS